MKLALVTYTSNEVGGIDTFNKNLARALREGGHDLSMVTLDGFDRKP